MATFSETFLCTALPERVSGTKIRVAVLVSPRLMSDSGSAADLGNWPDVRDWPSIQPTWQVTITQGGTTATLPATEVLAEPYDQSSWASMFPASMPVTPYQPKDRSRAPIFSYPAAKVRDAVRDLHMDVLTDSRAEFPSVEQLVCMPKFRALKRAADPEFVDEVMRSQDTDPVPDASAGVAEAFAMADLFHGVRPGSQPPPPPPPPPLPTITRVNPNGGSSDGGERVTITGTNFITPLTVKFGTGLATEASLPDVDIITCTTPRGPLRGAVPVTVTTEAGTSTSPVTFTYSGLG
jgi:hypothetical protein